MGISLPSRRETSCSVAVREMSTSASSPRPFDGTVYVCETPACRRIAHIVSELATESFPHFSSLTDPIDELVGFHEDEACLWLLLHDGRGVRGMAMLARYHDSMYISSLCVSPSYRCSGGGSLLLRSASALAASLGLDKLSGSVDGQAASLRSFYSRLGAVAAHASQIASANAIVHSVRLEAPSGSATDGGVPVPSQLPQKFLDEWRKDTSTVQEARRPQQSDLSMNFA